MIKVNLNKTKNSVYHTRSTGMASSGSSVFTQLKTVISENVDVNPFIFIKFIVNAILILCFPLGLKIYEINEIRKLNKEKSQAETVLSGTQNELSSLKLELAKYDHLKSKAQEFSDKKAFLKELADSRLVIPRMIDLIQNKVPKTVWLEDLSLNISEQKNELQMTGKSFSEAHVNAFASSLHDILDKNSVTVNTRDIKEGDSVVKVNFSLKGVM